MNEKVKSIQNSLEPVFRHYKKDLRFGYCFGSLASGNPGKLSDVDLAFYVSDAERAFDMKIELYTECSLALKRNDIDVVILNSLDNLVLAWEITRDGVVIYDADPEGRKDYELKIQHTAIDFLHQRKMNMGI